MPQRIIPDFDPSRLSHEELAKVVHDMRDLLDDLINGRLDGANINSGSISLKTRAKDGKSLAGNLDMEYLTVTTPVGAGTEFGVTHHLNRVPEGWFPPVEANNPVVLYTGTTAWTKETIYLKANAGSVTIRFPVY